MDFNTDGGKILRPAGIIVGWTADVLSSKTLRRILPLFLLPLAAAASAARADGLAALDNFLRNTPAAVIRFEERGFDADGDQISRREGVLRFRRPGFFRLHYPPPEELLVVSDNESVWFYEADLRQVVIRPFSDLSQLGFLAIFAGDGVDGLAERYVLSSGLAKDLRWAIADIANEGDSLRQVRLGFDAAGRLLKIEITDAFDGAIKIEIREVRRGDIGDDRFSFRPPPGTEIVDDR